MAYVSISPGRAFKSGQRLTANFDQNIFTAPAGLPVAKSMPVSMPKKVAGISGQTNVTVLSSPIGTSLYKASQKILQYDIVTNTQGTSIVRSAMVPNVKPRMKYEVTILRGK